MYARQFDTLITTYLERVSEQLHDLPAAERSEIIADLRAHIEDSIREAGATTEAEVRNVLDRIGDPLELAREARERASGGDSSAAPPVYRRVKTGPGALEVAGIVITAIFWPIGLLLVWLSTRWKTRDKVVGTIIPVLGFVLLIVMLFPVTMGASATYRMMDVPRSVVGPMERAVEHPRQFAQPRDPSIFRQFGSYGETVLRLVAVLSFVFGVIGAPFVSAIYLAFRLRPAEEMFYPDGTRVEHNLPVSLNA